MDEEENLLMKRRLQLAVLVLALVLAAGGIHAGATTIGELLGWNTSEESSDSSKASDTEDKSGKKKGSDDSRNAKDNSDYYKNLEIDEDASYDTKDEVCAYLVQFHRLPSNYMTKKQARKEGWERGPLHQTIPGRCIGGDVFGNYQEILPEKDGRMYHECDIDTLTSESRGPKRIIYSGDDDNGDWNIYYTDDHYETFELLWGDDNYE